MPDRIQFKIHGMDCGVLTVAGFATHVSTNAGLAAASGCRKRTRSASTFFATVCSPLSSPAQENLRDAFYEEHHDSRPEAKPLRPANEICKTHPISSPQLDPGTAESTPAPPPETPPNLEGPPREAA